MIRGMVYDIASVEIAIDTSVATVHITAARRAALHRDFPDIITLKI